MSNPAATDLRQWLVSARSRGELLTTSARSPGVELVMVGVPAGYSAEEVESWLRDLMGMSLESATSELGELPIPALLHHLLTGLVFSHSELWDRGGAAAPTSMAFIRTERDLAFGWVNGPTPDLWIDDQPAQVEWVKIRDPEGREACALAIDPAHRVRVHFGFGPGSAPVASVDGVWVPDAAAAAAALEAERTGGGRAASTISRAVGARASAPADASGAPIASTRLPRGDEGWTVVYEGDPAGGSPHGDSGRRRPWWANVTEWISGGAKRRDAFESTLPEVVPPSPEPAELTAQTAGVTVFEPNAVTGEIELAPLAPEDPLARPAAPAPAGELLVESVHLDAPVARRWSAAPPAAAPPPIATPAAPPASATRVAPPVSAPAAAPVRKKAKPAPSSARPAAPPAARPAAPPAARTEAPPAARPSAPPATPAPSPPVMAPAPQPAAEPVAAAAAPLDPLADEDSGLLSAPPRVPRRVRSLEWSEPTRDAADAPVWARPWVWGSAVVLLFLGGWMLGMQNDHPDGEPSGLAKAMRAIGIGGARFDAKITSRPPGAWISVDGKDVARRTPATVDLSPGTHQIGLTLADLGGTTFEVRGVRGDKTTLDADLAGSLAVYAGDGSIPVAITVDGVMRGIAPVTVDSLEPGTHEVRFSGPGLQPWGKTVQVRIHETAQLTARALTSPATGVLETRAQWTDTEGSEELTGATVYIDGVRRGATPLSLELPRGPHSVRIESRGERSPVQVIDLPGGNQRFANFELGLGIDRPTLAVLGTPIRVRAEEPAAISAALQGLHATEVREMWLNVRQPDGAWRRSPMMMMNAPGGVVGTAVLPSTLLDKQGRTLFYVSASSQQGDDYFSEILTATLAGGD